MEQVALTHSSVVIYNAGPANITVEGYEVDSGGQIQFMVFKGVDIHGDVSTGNRSFKVKVVDNPIFQEASDADEIGLTKVSPL